ncbi:M56 family metallopeptidase [Polaribacter septentrionalilitoris]|uniref:M56 family metallopeptidase n=1 Tax=Polaribacter septentrionalilitoris TaxID=2494657 RepID=UPI00135ABC75|nr:M56 family metallopeptidase [Polaribacter septentrionalilitoris]
MEYLLKVCAITTLFYVCYLLFLQQKTFFEQNRWFLLLGIVTALILPLITITNSVERVPIRVNEIESFRLTEPIQFITPVTNSINDLHIDESMPIDVKEVLQLIYVLGVLFFTIRFLIQLSSLLRFIFTSKKIKKGQFTIIERVKKSSPFSFFNWIIYNPKDYTTKELEQILIHEKVHATQKHTIDVLLMQLSCIMLWFNPFIWLYNRLVKQNLEFIADAKTQEQLNCKQTYQFTLLKETVVGKYAQLSNLFYSSLIKKRIVMLNKEKSKKINFIKYSFVLPLLAVFFMNFNINEVYTKNENGDYKEFLFLSSFSESEVHEFQAKLETQGYDFKIKKIKRNDKNLITGIYFNVSKEEVRGEYRMFSGKVLGSIAIRHFEKENKMFIQQLSFLRAYDLVSTNKNTVEIIIEKEKDTKYLDKLKKDFKEKYDVDFTYEINQTSNATFSYQFINNDKLGNKIKTAIDRKLGLKYDPDRKILIQYGFDKDGDISYGRVTYLKRYKSFRIMSYYTDNSLERAVKKFEKQNITIDFFNVKRNEKNEITAISIIANSKEDIITYNVDNKKAIHPIAINYADIIFNIELADQFQLKKSSK